MMVADYGIYAGESDSDHDDTTSYDLENDDAVSINADDSLARYVTERFERAKDGRREQEEKWVQAYYNFRGVYSDTTQFTDTEKSRVFIKVTKTKVLAAYGLLLDILFPSNGHKFPVMVSPTPIPEAIAESVHFDPKAPPTTEKEEAGSPYGYPGDGKDLGPGDTHKTLMDRLGAFKDKLMNVGPKLKEGPGATPTSATFYPADEAAIKMDKKMQDQFYEGRAHKALRKAVFESCLFGTGIVKGPYSRRKEYPRWVKHTREGMTGMKYEPVIKHIPYYDHIVIWNFYPDPDVRDEEDLGYVVVRHRLMRHDLRGLANRPHFDKDAIQDAINDGENYTKQWWEDNIDDDTQSSSVERFEGLEYWGVIDRDMADEHNINIPTEYEDEDVLQASIYVVNGRVLKAVVNPYRPTEINFHAFRYEENPYSYFGIGLAENMDDTQTLMNGFMRLGVDNAALSGNMVFEVDEDALVPGQDMTVYPGKTFRRQAGAVGQALFSHKFNNVTNENLQMFDKARQLADESTGFPSFAHGQTGVSGIGRTASGISMLMGAASTNIKTVLKNYDDALERIGKAQFSYNMQFEASDEETIGDLDIKSRGTDQLMSSEVRSQRLMTFLNVGANQMTAPFMKFPYLLREIAKTLDLDPDRATNSPEEAMLQAEMLKGMMPPTGAGQGGPGAAGAAGAIPGDPTGSGGGNIGVGTAPGPGAAGFSGAPPGGGNGAAMGGMNG